MCPGGGGGGGGGGGLANCNNIDKDLRSNGTVAIASTLHCMTINRSLPQHHLSPAWIHGGTG